MLEHSIEKLREGKSSLFAKFLKFIGIDVDVTVSWEHRYALRTLFSVQPTR